MVFVLTFEVSVLVQGVTAVTLHPGLVATRINGYDADGIPVEESVRSLLALLDREPAKLQGRFYSYDGTEIPW